MFLEKIDWDNPRFSRWNLSKLGELNEAQLNAFFDDDDIDFPDFTETELKELALKVPCRVELFHSNVCYGVESKWPKIMFNKPSLSDLRPYHKHVLKRQMIRFAVKLYRKYVDEERLKRRKRRRTNRALAPYYTERLIRNRFYRIKALGDPEPAIDGTSDTETSLLTVINTQDNESDVSSNVVGDEQRTPDSEIEKQSRLVYEDSSDEVYMSANEEELTPPRTRSKMAAIENSNVRLNESSSFVTPSKDVSELSMIGTPAIEQLHQLRRNLIRIDSDDNSSLSVEQNFEMFIQMNDKRKKSPQKTPMQATSRYSLRSTGINMIDLSNVIENVNDSDGSMSSDDNPLVIDERFNDLLSESSVSTFSVRNTNVANDKFICVTPQIDSSEFVLVSAENFDNNLNLFLSPIIEQVQTSTETRSNRYSLRNRTPK